MREPGKVELDQKAVKTSKALGGAKVEVRASGEDPHTWTAFSVMLPRAGGRAGEEADPCGEEGEGTV